MLNHATIKLLKKVAQTGSATFLSRILGVVRDILFARTLGSSIYADAVFVALTIPNAFRAICTESALLAASVPICVDYLRRFPSRSTASVWSPEVSAYLGLATGWISLIMLAAVCLGQLSAGLIVRVLAPGFLNHPEKFAVTVQSLQIMFPYLLTVALTTFLGSILHTYQRFVLLAFSATLVNVGFIVAMTVFSESSLEPSFVISLGMLAGGVTQLLVVAFWLRRLGLLPAPCLTNATRSGSQGKEGAKRLMHHTSTLAGSNVFRQFATLSQTFFASFMVAGSVTWLYYANRFFQLPIGVFAIALSQIMLPNLSLMAQKKDQGGFIRASDFAIRWIFLVAVPCAVCLYQLAEIMIATFFQYGKFGSKDVFNTAIALKVYSLGLMFTTLQLILTQMLIALDQSRTIFKISIISCIFEVALSFALTRFLDHTALAWSRTITAFFVCGAYTTVLFTWGYLSVSIRLLVFLLRVGIASALLYLTLDLLLEWIGTEYDLMSLWDRSWRLGALGLSSVAVYVAVFVCAGGRFSSLELKSR